MLACLRQSVAGDHCRVRGFSGPTQRTCSARTLYLDMFRPISSPLVIYILLSLSQPLEERLSWGICSVLFDINHAVTKATLMAGNASCLFIWFTYDLSFRMRECQARGCEAVENPGGPGTGCFQARPIERRSQSNHRHLTAAQNKRFTTPLILLTRCNSFSHLRVTN